MNAPAKVRTKVLAKCPRCGAKRKRKVRMCRAIRRARVRVFRGSWIPVLGYEKLLGIGRCFWVVGAAVALGAIGCAACVPEHWGTKLLAAVWVIAPPLYFAFEHMALPQKDDHRDYVERGQDLSAKVWLGVVAVLAFLLTGKLDPETEIPVKPPPAKAWASENELKGLEARVGDLENRARQKSQN